MKNLSYSLITVCTRSFFRTIALQSRTRCRTREEAATVVATVGDSTQTTTYTNEFNGLTAI